ncbi:MAG: tetratricopeptide repeat protein [Saprospiraceae bacterium]
MSQRLELLQSMLEESPNDSFLLFALAKEYEKIKQPDDAMNAYMKLKETNPDYVGLYYHLGKLLEQKERIEEAFFTYKEGMLVAKKEGDQHSFNELAGAKLGLGDDEDFE